MEKHKNQVLSSSDPVGNPDAVQGAAPSQDTEYPKALYSKKQSKPGAPVSKLVASAEEEKAAGDDWVPFGELKTEDAE